MKLQILSECKQQLQTRSRGTLKFFVRNGQIQKIFRKNELRLIGGSRFDLAVPEAGMTPAMIKQFLALVEDALQQYERIDYGHISITYRLNPDGSQIDDMAVEWEDEKHLKIL